MYSDVDNIISDIIAYYDNTDTSAVHNLTVRQARIRHYLQRTAEDLWFWRPWPFTIKSDTVALSGGSGTLPADFALVSYEGGVYDSSGKPWTEIDLQSMLYLRNRTIEAGRHFYAISGTDLLVPDTGSSETFTLIYQMVAPALVSGSIGGFPLPFGEVLLLGGVVKLKEEEGDARQNWRGDYFRALARVAGLFTRQSRARQMPVTVGGMW